MEGKAPGAPEGSRIVAERVLVARQRSAARNPGGCANAELPAASLAQALRLDAAALALWEQAIRQRHLSARSGARLLRVARTISDLEQQERVGPAAVAEALTYRSFDGLGMGTDAALSGSSAAAGRGRAAQPPGGGDGPLAPWECRRRD
jgi:magnesium chelatase family protein